MAPPKSSVAHTRFARAALAIYAGAAALAIVLLVGTLTTDKSHDEDQARSKLVLENEAHAHYLSHHLGLLVTELRRLSTRSEINLGDEDLDPERSLLQLSHEKSTFFNLGVAILGADGKVVWAEPAPFLPIGEDFGGEPWFAQLSASSSVRVVPVAPDQPDAVLYVVSPVIRAGVFSGALLGGIDLAQSDSLDVAGRSQVTRTILTTAEGKVVYPPRPPALAREQAWTRTIEGASSAPSTVDVTLEDNAQTLAIAPLSESGLILVALAERARLYAPAKARFRLRLVYGLVVAAIPLGLLVVLLGRSLRELKRAEAEEMRQARLRHLGEAANLIAHEVRNSLNGLAMGLDVIMRGQGGQRVAEALRKEIARITQFSTELMTFSKGVVPRPVDVDLAELVPKVIELAREQAGELGVTIDVTPAEAPIKVKADPALLHVVISNLVGNGLEALAGRESGARVGVAIGAHASWAELRVSDNGPGVAPDVKAQLFEPFVTGKPSGVGIGLALSRKIARAHGGDLVLDDAARETTFVLTVPLATEVKAHA
jgi:two-component system C4-dicarboxylate transport sensor histidine kinase DctB